MHEPFKHTWGAWILNVVSGLALLAAASWFSYNVFETRDINARLRTVLSDPEQVPLVPPALTPGGELNR